MTRPTARRILLEQPRDAHQPLLMSERVSLGEGAKESWETITRAVKFDDDYYGTVEITRAMLMSFKRNFDANTYGQDIAIDVAHMHSDGAAAFVRELAIDKGRLRARLEWTEFGIDAVTKRGFRYLSADYHEDWKNPETGEKHGPLLFGAGLTVRPRVKGLDRIDPDPLRMSLSFDTEQPIAVAPRLRRILLSEAIDTMEKHIAKLRKQLSEQGLSEKVIEQIVAAYKNTAVQLGENESALADLVASFTESAKSIAEQLGDKPATINLSVAAPSGALDEAAVKRLLAEAKQADEAAAKQLAETTAAKHQVFTDAINAAEGLDDDTKRQLCEQGVELIAPAMSDAQIKKFAEGQIAQANQLVAARELASLGYPMQGTARITQGDDNAVKHLQETVDRRLGILDMPDSRRFANTGGVLLAENKALADRVLAQFDREHGAQLHAERKMLAGGDGIVSDVNVPVSWERTVIREALYRLIGLQFVNAGTEVFNTAYSIPYSYRDTTAAGKDSTRKYEGQSVLRAGVIQTAETAYNIPQKLAFEVSDELRYLTSARHLNWDAVAENQQNASRIIGEDLEALIFNEILRAADEYGAVAVSNAALTAQVNGTNNVFLLPSFPVVRPRSVFDLQGNQVGSTLNPITVTLGGSAITEYDGTGTQSAGNYWSLDYNLGEIRIVNQAGALQTPTNATALVISYSRSTNVYAFDTDLGSATAGVHWNSFLYRYGLRKAVIEDDRFHMANYGLMSGTVMTQVEQADQFGANSKRNGTDLASDGNLGRIKDVPNFKTSAPGLHMGDQRIVVAERGITRFRLTKPWQLGELENQKDSNGRFTGKKEAYGDQFVVLHTPTQLKRAATSMVVYSATARATRAE